jgi:sulfatase modifying factor 1
MPALHLGLSCQRFMSDDLLPAFAAIPAGPFVMGSDDGPAEERPAHTVHLDEFAIGVQLITNAEYGRFVHETGYRAPVVDDLPLVVRVGGEEREREFRASGDAYAWKGAHPPGDRLDHPVTLVRWEAAAAYCRWLSEVLERVVRLPSEAEWEKAARGGLDRKPYPWGDGLNPDRANFLNAPERKAEAGTTRCRRYPPNGYGLFDISGNAWEWVHDWYDPGFYGVSPEKNPVGPLNGQSRIVRGGGWLTAEPAMLTCSHRHEVPPDTYSYGIGFRVAASP